jgi:hypothetical protein
MVRACGPHQSVPEGFGDLDGIIKPNVPASAQYRLPRLRRLHPSIYRRAGLDFNNLAHDRTLGMSSAALRAKRHRARAKDGRVVLMVEVDEIALAEQLVEAGLLERQDSDDRKAIAAALQVVVDLWAAGSVTRDDIGFRDVF